MQLATTFITAVLRLSANEAKQVWNFVDKIRNDPNRPGLNLERLKRSRSKNLWSARISADLRAILYICGDERILLYVDHHDEAYRWAELHDVEKNPASGRTEIINLPQVELSVERVEKQPEVQRKLFDRYNDEYLLSVGLPQLYLPLIRGLISEEELFEFLLKSSLSEEMGDILMKLAFGEMVIPPISGTANGELVVVTEDDLDKLLKEPFSAWAVYLHPSQERLAKGKFNGPVKVSGGAGTGKTIVALHRARHLAKQGKQVLLTTYVTTLCANLKRNLQLICTKEELDQITVSTVHTQAMALLKAAGQELTPIGDAEVKALIRQHAERLGCEFSTEMLELEWHRVIQTNGINTWDGYSRVERKGRGSRLSQGQRRQVWSVFEQVLRELEDKSLVPWSTICQRACEVITSRSVHSRYDCVIVDEMQDLNPYEIRLLAMLAKDEQDGLMLIGDDNQRIYSAGMSLQDLGIEVRGRSYVLRTNYRTTRQIVEVAHKVLYKDKREKRLPIRNLLEGPEPVWQRFNDWAAQLAFVSGEIKKLLSSGFTASSIAVFARKNELVKKAEKELSKAGIKCCVLSSDMDKEQAEEEVALGTMHRAKGLEFRVVFVIELSDQYLPPPAVLKMQDEQAREEKLELERQLLYVSMTRARDRLYMTWVGEPSPFLKPIVG
ncbi:MAG: ATP-dependent helicase [Acidobacteriota bacterium]|nr:ATP-dependent helicase [Blastocatellia bacterium]MDW8412975.1 ATP-dependent helicase [Acidobacteriota bacterium]